MSGLCCWNVSPSDPKEWMRRNVLSAHKALFAASEWKRHTATDWMGQIIWSARSGDRSGSLDQRLRGYASFSETLADDAAQADMARPDDPDRARGCGQKSLAAGDPAGEAEHQLGTCHWALGRATPLRDDHGRTTFWFGACADVQGTAEMREALAQSRAELAETAQKLAHAEEQLRQSRKMEAVGQLTGGIVHDFNNVLTGVIGNLELIQLRVAAGRSDGLERYTAMAAASAERAAALAQRLLTFARRQPLDSKRVEVDRLLSGMEDLLRRALEPAVSLELAPAGALWPTLCDPNQLENAILNLAINARDAMPNGGRLTVETSNVQLDEVSDEVRGGMEPGQHVVIAVTDTGFGMEPEVVAKAFDPFFTTKPTGQGTGLGLSMLYDFIKQSNGHVRVDSEPGVGTTFRIYLPRCREDGGAATEPAGSQPAA